MKIKSLAIVVLSALSLSSAAALADTTVNGGTVHFKGEVVNAACAIDAGSIDQTVPMGGTFGETGDCGQHQHGCRLQYPAERL